MTLVVSLVVSIALNQEMIITLSLEIPQFTECAVVVIFNGHFQWLGGHTGLASRKIWGFDLKSLGEKNPQ